MLPPSAWMPNGAKPFGIFGSSKPPAVATGCERRVEDVDAAVVEVGRVQAVVQRREPLVDGAARRAVDAATAVVAFTVGDQPRIVPASRREEEASRPLTCRSG